MKKTILFFLLGLALTGSAVAQKQTPWGIGIRAGDPSGLTLKRYQGSTAWEFNLGRTHVFHGRGYYDRRFNRWYERQYDFHDYRYRGVRAFSPGVGVQVRYLVHKPLFGEPGLVWYYGAGAQLRFQRFIYRYEARRRPGDPWRPYEEEVVNFDIGVDGILGIEYTIPDLPLSVFADINLFVEIIDNPFYMHMQGGAGVRYRF